ncbi:MAG: U32 family peptidase [Clostridia bacterium]|nr:U32 family peptidase [Clostridia bacterium]
MMEILAPCGNEESFFAAVNNGATAVYLGMSDFSARRNAANFTRENISYFCSYAHALDVKVYVALNTLIKDEELGDFFETAKVVYEAGADAFIIQDVFMGKTLKTYFPDIELHLSTQAGVNDVYGAGFAKENLFDRVILARETGADEIREIAKFIDVEIFAHGALCSCFSGHCYASSFIGGNSGNRGLCKQPCRQKYSLETKEGGRYPISLADLALIDRIKDIEALGVKSIKIEGRMRSPEYVGFASRCYRNAVEGKSYSLDEIKRTFNRGDFTEGYTFGIDDKLISDKVQGNIGLSVGRIGQIKGRIAVVDGKEVFSVGDCFKILRKGYEVGSAVCVKNGKEVEIKGDAVVGDEVRITKDESLRGDIEKNKKYKNLSVKAVFKVGERASFSSEGITVYSDEPLEKAVSSGVSESEIVDNLYKTDKYPFRIAKAEIEIDGEQFIPKSKLNKMRSSLYEKVFSKGIKSCKIADFKKDFSYNFKFEERAVVMTDDLSDICFSEEFFVVYAPKNYGKAEEEKVLKIREKHKVFLFVPAFTDKKQSDEILSIVDKFDGIYADGLNGVGIAKSLNLKFIAGIGLNIFNSLDLSYLSESGDCVPVLSQEISKSQLSELGDNAGYLFSKGSIRLMEFIYCPFGRKCSSCKRGEWFSLKDEMGHNFRIRRYVLGKKCVFEVYNGACLSIPEAKLNFYNIIGLDRSALQRLKNGDPKIKTTWGNYKRGAL